MLEGLAIKKEDAKRLQTERPLAVRLIGQPGAQAESTVGEKALAERDGQAAELAVKGRFAGGAEVGIGVLGQGFGSVPLMPRQGIIDQMHELAERKTSLIRGAAVGVLNGLENRFGQDIMPKQRGGLGQGQLVKEIRNRCVHASLLPVQPMTLPMY